MEIKDFLDYSDLGINLFSHQEECIKKLNFDYINNNRKKGLVVVPTGGGKTTIASTWVIKNIIDKGYNVLWLCHRIILLRQANKTFSKYLTTKHYSYDLNKLTVISHKDSSWFEINKKTKYVFCTDKTASKNIDAIKGYVDNSKNGLVLVIDEAHHSLAPTYLKILNKVDNYINNNNKNLMLLGLTATPFRFNIDETKNLCNLYNDNFRLESKNKLIKTKEKNSFDNHILYSIPHIKLIERGILAKPKINNYLTKIAMEDKLIDKDIEELKKTHHISPNIARSIGENSIRNSFIVEEYLKQRIYYGKTIVFCTDIHHAKILEKVFRDKGVRAKATYYTLDDEEHKNIIKKYKYDSLEVLINVLKLTEGFDAPKTKTVFITTPTSSEVLVKQMVGRALRGPKAGGTKIANLVTFVDTWKHFHPINPNTIIDMEKNTNSIIDIFKSNNNQKKPIKISSKILYIIYKIHQKHTIIYPLKSYSAFPYAWINWKMNLDNVDEEEGFNEIEYNLLIFENQSIHFEMMVNYIYENLDELEDASESLYLDIYKEIFKDCPTPIPPTYKILPLIEAIIKENENININIYEDRKDYSPKVIAQNFLDRSLSKTEFESEIKILYKDHNIYELIYDNIRNFKKEVMYEMDNLLNQLIPNANNIDFSFYINNISPTRVEVNPIYDPLNNAEALIYTKKTSGSDFIEHLSENLKNHLNYTELLKELEKLKDKKIISELIFFYQNKYPKFNPINFFKDHDQITGDFKRDYLNILLSFWEKIMAVKNKEMGLYYDKNLFGEKIPDFNNIYYSKQNVEYLSTSNNKEKHVIINRKICTPEIPLFVIQYLIYRELIKLNTNQKMNQYEYHQKLKNFEPSTFAKNDLYNKDTIMYNIIKNTDNKWYKLSNELINNIKVDSNNVFRLKKVFDNI